MTGKENRLTHRLAAGDAAPDVTLTTSDGTGLRLSELRGHSVVRSAYRAAGTPGCTAEACDFRDDLGSLGTAGYAVIGVSPDRPGDLRRFAQEQALTLPLLADPGHAGHVAELRRLLGVDGAAA